MSGAEARMAARSKTTSAREGARAGIPPETKDLLLTSEIRWEEKAWCSGDWRPEPTDDLNDVASRSAL